MKLAASPRVTLILAGALLLTGVSLLTKDAVRTSADLQESSIAPFTDYRGEKPGVTRRITAMDLPRPYLTVSASNPPQIIRRPSSAWPQAPSGFVVDQYVTGLNGPRIIRTAPNGDLFVVESGAGRIRVVRAQTEGALPRVETFATGLTSPFGVAFYPPGSGSEVCVRGEHRLCCALFLPERRSAGSTEAAGRAPEAHTPQANGGHWTRDIAFSLDGLTLFVSIGSLSNIDDVDNNAAETHRANILETDPEGGELRVYASGLRNPVGLAVDTVTGDLWTSVNERDGLGDNLPPDYITHVRRGGFYGWPWYYIGGNQDPRLAGKHPELQSEVIVPDVLIQPHDASLGLTFYDGDQFPEMYQGDIFAAEHGSWNRSVRTGYEVIRVRRTNGRATGEYEDFLTGFVSDNGQVWGRPVGVAVGIDGSLFVTDDASNTIWRVRYSGGRRKQQ